MAYLLVKQKVADFDQWLSVFELNRNEQEASGLNNPQILRDVDDSNLIVCLFHITDMNKAKQFTSASAIEKAQQDSSLIGSPEVLFFEEIHF